MTIPQATPLLLLSEYVLMVNINSGNLTSLNTNEGFRLRNAIASASSFLQMTCGRRFDEYLDTRFYASLDERIGGDLLGPFDLMVDADFKTVAKLINGDGSTLTSYKIISPNRQPGAQNVNASNRIRLNMYAGITFRSGTNDPYNSIQVSGTIGYGGQWLNLPITVTGDTGSIMTFSDGTILETGMLLKLTNTNVTPNTFEYIYVDAVPSSAGGNVTVGRAYNNSTTQTWPNGTAVQYFQALEVVRDVVRRLVQWKQEQIKSPVASTATVGDFSFPVNLSGLPTDLYLIIRDAHLLNVDEGEGV